LIELALSFGFKGIDLDIVEFAEAVRTHGMPHARRLFDSAKLKYGGFKLPVQWHADDATYRAELSRLDELAAIAAQLGCTRALTEMAPASDERPYHQNFEFHRHRLAELGKALAGHNIRLGFGFSAAAEARRGRSFEFIHDLDALSMLLGMVGAKNVGLIVDLWDMHVAGNSLASLRKAGVERIVAVRLADAPDEGAASELSQVSRLLPGETGAIDSTAALVALAEMGYDGPVTPAPHATRFQGMRRDAIVKLAGEKLDQAWKAAGLSPAGKLSASVGRS
jgi:sugar phosphate isomerase/epimerase